MIVGGLNGRAAGGSARMDAHERLSVRPHMIDRPAIGVVDAHELCRRHGKDNRVDFLRLKARMIERQPGGLLREFHIGFVGMMMFELRLTDTDHRNGPFHDYAFSKIATLFPCCAKPWQPCARALFTPAICMTPACRQSCRTASAAFTRPAQK